MKLLISFIFTMMFVGCASTPQMKYYILDSRPGEQYKVNVRNLVEVSNVRLPIYLDQPKIVLRKENQEITLANYHSWAENLNVSIKRLIAKELNKNATNFGFVDSCFDCNKLTVEITHFYPTTDGDVYLTGQFILKKRSQEIFRENFNLSNKLDESGYGEAVNKMNALIIELSAAIASKIMNQ